MRIPAVTLPDPQVLLQHFTVRRSAAISDCAPALMNRKTSDQSGGV